MRRNLSALIKYAFALSVFVPPYSARAETVLYSFKAGSDGRQPYASLIKDSAGNFYGTTTQGGGQGYGTVFRLASDGTETVLHGFTGGNDGANPFANVIKDASGNLYGTTTNDGANGAGTVFKVAADGSETVLYSFCQQLNCTDGGEPDAGLIKNSAGNLYGTTSFGGVGHFNCCGTVFKLAADGAETVLYSFCQQPNCTDGSQPHASVIKDSAGNLYGTTSEGGAAYGMGAVFKLAPDGTETVLYSFTGTTDGGTPVAGLIKDSAGNLYGTTPIGGVYDYGIVFRLAPDGTETVLYSFTGGSDGGNPNAGLIEGKK